MRTGWKAYCLLQVVLLVFTIILIFPAAAGEATDPYDIKEEYTLKYDVDDSAVNDSSKNRHLGKEPDIVYPVWGYSNHSYNFSVNYNVSLDKPENTTIVFYWDCWRNTSKEYYSLLHVNEIPRDYMIYSLNNFTFNIESKDGRRWIKRWNCSHAWKKNGTYGIQTAVFEEEKNGKQNLTKVSFWLPIKIKEESIPEKPHLLTMKDEEGERSKDGHAYSLSEHDSSCEIYYCGYEGRFYTFTTAANDPEGENIWFNFSWDDGSSDVTRRQPPGVKQNYTHSWVYNEKPYKIKTKAIKRDLYDPNRDVESERNDSVSVLIIHDPKNYPLAGMHISISTIGICIFLIGLFVLVSTLTKKSVLVEVSAFERKFSQKSIFILISLIFLTSGLHMYFLCGRCPWDIPLLGNSEFFGNIYFSLLLNGYLRWIDRLLFILLFVLPLLAIFYIYRPSIKNSKINVRKWWARKEEKMKKNMKIKNQNQKSK